MAYNKVIYGGKTLIDLTGDTVTADKVLVNVTTHDKNGNMITGTCTYDSNTQDATIAVAEMLTGKTAYVRGQKITGSMPNRGSATGTISSLDGQYTIQQGYHDGSGKVSISASEKAKLTPENIREGVVVLGVEGTMSGSENENVQDITVTPTAESQSIIPDEGYTCFREITVNPIPYMETPNAAGGVTVTIG